MKDIVHPVIVIPAKAGIQKTLDMKPSVQDSFYRASLTTTALCARQFLDSRLRGNDGEIELTLLQEHQ